MIGNASNGKILILKESAKFMGTHQESSPLPLREPATSSAEAGIEGRGSKEGYE